MNSSRTAFHVNEVGARYKETSVTGVDKVRACVCVVCRAIKEALFAVCLHGLWQ